MWLGRDGHIDYTTIKALVDSCMGLTFFQSLLATPVHGYEGHLYFIPHVVLRWF